LVARETTAFARQFGKNADMPDFPRAIRGYHRDQVDALIARIEGTLGRSPLYAPPVTVAEVGGLRFTPTLRGYQMKAVDEALDEYLRELEGHVGGRRRMPSGEADRLIGLVRNVQFVTTRLTEGYDEEQVDVFLDRMIVALREHRALAADVRGVRFATTRIRAGYSQSGVDAFLERLASEIERLRRG
jgi:DivIVA domain-containing protein